MDNLIIVLNTIIICLIIFFVSAVIYFSKKENNKCRDLGGLLLEGECIKVEYVQEFYGEE